VVGAAVVGGTVDVEVVASGDEVAGGSVARAVPGPSPRRSTMPAAVPPTSRPTAARTTMERFARDNTAL
jgi:hypothetical protein